MNDIECIIPILLSQVFKNTNFFLGLPMEAFLVPNDFQSHLLAWFVIVTFHYQTEGTFSQYFQNFITYGRESADDPHSNLSMQHTVSNVIMLNSNVWTILFIVVT